VTSALVIGRRRDGRPIGKAVRETAHRLAGAGWTVDSELVNRKRDLRKAAAQAVKKKVDVVVAVGGDGAVLQVVQSLAETDVALGIVPLGTGNLLAGNLGIPKRLDRAIEVLMGGGRRRIDLGRVTVSGKRWHFSVACGIGFDAEVMEATEAEQKDRWGKLAYVASAIRQSHRVHDVTHAITIDGVENAMEATQVFIANFGRMGLAMKPRLHIEPDDGVLDVVVIEASGRLPGILAGWEALNQGEEGESSGGHAFRSQAHKVLVDSEPSRLVEIDGSVVGATPIKVSIRPASLSVVIPKPEET